MKFLVENETRRIIWHTENIVAEPSKNCYLNVLTNTRITGINRYKIVENVPLPLPEDFLPRKYCLNETEDGYVISQYYVESQKQNVTLEDIKTGLIGMKQDIAENQADIEILKTGMQKLLQHFDLLP